MRIKTFIFLFFLLLYFPLNSQIIFKNIKLIEEKEVKFLYIVNHSPEKNKIPGIFKLSEINEKTLKNLFEVWNNTFYIFDEAEKNKIIKKELSFFKEKKESNKLEILEYSDGIRINNGLFKIEIFKNVLSFNYKEKENKIQLDISEASKTKILHKSENMCVIRIEEPRNFYEIKIFKNSPFLFVSSNSLSFSINGFLYIHSFSSDWGTEITKGEEWKGTVYLFYPEDWGIVEMEGLNLWLSPEINGTPIEIEKKVEKGISELKIRYKKMDEGLDKKLGHGQPYGKDSKYPQRDLTHWKENEKQEIIIGVLNSVNEGLKARNETRQPLILTYKEGNLFYGKNLIGDEEYFIICEDINKNNEPDFVNDIWYFVDEKGNIRSKFEFKDEDNDGRPEKLFFYGDWKDFKQDGLIDEIELQNPLVCFHDWTKDGLFTKGSYFFGGNNAKDWFETKMHWGVNSDKEKITDNFSYSEKVLDIDDDNDWDVLIRNDGKSGLVFDYGDINSNSGIIINPFSGFFFYNYLYTYMASPGVFGYASLVTKEGEYWMLKGWMDMPQADINLDEDESPECHVMSQIVLTDGDESKESKRGYKGKVVRYTENRMTLDMDNDNFGVFNNPYAPTFSRGRGFNLMITPETFITPEGYKRLPVYPAEEIEFTDKYGNKIIATGKYMVKNWDGKKLSTFDKKGKPLEWTYAWKWSMEQKWDAVGAVWRENDHNPEAMQIYAPCDLSDIRFDCDINQNTDFYIYYSPINGFCHLKGADWGFRGLAVPPYISNEKDKQNYWNQFNKKREYFTKELWWNVGFDIAQWVRDPDCGRYPFNFYEVYFDNDNDGFYDVYLQDIDNDGFYEKRIYLKGNELILINNNYALKSKISINFPFQSIDFENYEKLVNLYKYSKENFTNRYLNLEIDKNGKVINFQNYFNNIKLEKIGIFNSNLWNEHGKDGLSRMITSICRFPFLIKKITEEDDYDELRYIFIPVETEINFEKVKEKIVNYVNKGGNLIIIGSKDENNIGKLNYLISSFGIRVIPEKLKFNVETDYTLLNPEKYLTKIKEQIKGKEYIVKGIKKIYYESNILEGKEITPILEINKRIIIGEKIIGKGKVIIISSKNLIENTYTAHNENKIPPYYKWLGIEHRQGMSDIWAQPDNNKLLDNLIDYIINPRR